MALRPRIIDPTIVFTRLFNNRARLTTALVLSSGLIFYAFEANKIAIMSNSRVSPTQALLNENLRINQDEPPTVSAVVVRQPLKALGAGVVSALWRLNKHMQEMHIEGREKKEGFVYGQPPWEY